MKQVNLKKLLLPNLPYLFIALFATKLGQAWRLTQGADLSEKVLQLMDGFAAAFQSFAPSLTKAASTQMEKIVITFNDLPEVVTQLRDEVMGLKSLLREQRSVNNAKAVDTHVPMSVKEAAEYLGIPKGTLYMKLSEGSIPATKPGKRYCLYRDELDRCWNPPGRIPYPCPMRNSANPYPLPTATSLIPVTGKNPWKRIRIISI